MPDPGIDNEAEDELDGLLADSQEKLPVAKLPPKPDFSKPVDFQNDPAAIDELDSVLQGIDHGVGEPMGRVVAGVPEVIKNRLGEDLPETPGQITLPVQKIEGTAPKQKAWYDGLIDKINPFQQSPKQAEADQNEMVRRLENFNSLGGAAKQLGSDVTSWWGNMLPGAGGGIAAKGAQGALAGAGNALSHNPDDLSGAAASGAVGGATGAVLQGLASKAAGIGQGADEVADMARLRSWGVPKNSLKELAQQEGTTVQKAGQNLVREGERLVPPNRFLGRSPGAWEEGFGAAKENAGSRVGQAITDAEAAGAKLPPDPKNVVADKLLNRAAQTELNGRASGLSEGNALLKEAEAIQRGPQFETPQQLREAKSAFEREAYGAQPGTPESFAGKAAQASAGELRDMLRNFVDEGGQGQNFSQANKDFGTSAMLQDAAQTRAAQAAAAGGPIGRAVGSIAGGGAGYLAGGVPGAVLGATVGAGARSAAANYGVDMGANIARGVARGADATAAGAGQAAKVAPIVAAQRENPDAPKQEIEDAANSALKEKMSQPNWYQPLLK